MPELTAAEARHREIKAMTEAELFDSIEELAHLHGWLIAHFRPAQTSRGWRTPVQGDGAGFPDLVLARRGQVIFAELKATKGAVSPQQTAWATALVSAPWPSSPHVGYFVWRPADLESGEIERELV